MQSAPFLCLRSEDLAGYFALRFMLDAGLKQRLTARRCDNL
jgi:hypothetical protein